MKELLERYNKLYEAGAVTHIDMTNRIGIHISVFFKWRDPKTKAIGSYDNMKKFKIELEKLEKELKDVK